MRRYLYVFFFSSRRLHTRCGRDWSSDVCSSDLSTFKSKLLSSGILIIFTLFILADTSYIPYVGGQMITLSFCGSQKILKTKSMISSLPFPIQILSTDIPFILERDFLRVRWCGSGYLFLFPNGFSLASRNIPSSPQNSSRALE